MQKQIKANLGFTIIEVVIVLAIAGLIFAVVFIAVPQLQQSQRDTARDSEFDRLESAITQFQSRNNGELPDLSSSTVFDDFVDDYMNDDFADPIGGSDWTVHNDPTNVNEDESYEAPEFFYGTGEVCEGNDDSTDGGDRNYAIIYAVEQGPTVCRDNS